jgi:hypothetical protein
MQYLKKALAALSLMTLLSACASITTLKSTPEGAKFYANGQYLGEGSVTYSDTKPVGAQTIIEIKKKGYANKTAVLSRTEQVNVGALVAGILLAPTVVGLLFFLWVCDYSPYHVFDLEPASEVIPKKASAKSKR